MRKYYCDRCLKEMDLPSVYIGLKHGLASPNSAYIPNLKYEICGECEEKFKEFMNMEKGETK